MNKYFNTKSILNHHRFIEIASLETGSEKTAQDGIFFRITRKSRRNLCSIVQLFGSRLLFHSTPCSLAFRIFICHFILCLNCDFYFFCAPNGRTKGKRLQTSPKSVINLGFSFTLLPCSLCVNKVIPESL
jgi:hypothetical protein